MTKYYANQKRAEPFQKFREEFIVPISGGNPELTRGREIDGNGVPAEYGKIVDAIDAWKKTVSDAGMDSTTEIGPMMHRYKTMEGSRKFLKAEYDQTAHLVHFSNSGEFYFKNSELVFFERKVTENDGKTVHLIQDGFYLNGGKVVYGFRDEGTSPVKSKSFNFVDVLRYQLNGDKDAHIAKAFIDFQDEYKILLTEKLEANFYMK